MDASEIPLTLADPASHRAPSPCWVTVSLAGEIDLATAPDVLATLLAASKSETAGIVVDVSAVTFFGAAGIGALMGARNHEGEHGRDLLLRAPPRVVRRVLDICRLGDLVEPPATTGHTSVPAAGPAMWRPGAVALQGSDR
jgi:anti-anti-sigma factor